MANRKKDKTLARVTISLGSDDYKAFLYRALQKDNSTASLIRRAMRAFLERQQGKRAVSPGGMS